MKKVALIGGKSMVGVPRRKDFLIEGSNNFDPEMIDKDVVKGGESNKKN